MLLLFVLKCLLVDREDELNEFKWVIFGVEGIWLSFEVFDMLIIVEFINVEFIKLLLVSIGWNFFFCDCIFKLCWNMGEIVGCMLGIGFWWFGWYKGNFLIGFGWIRDL